MNADRHLVSVPSMDPRLREILGGTVAVRVLTLGWSLVVVSIDVGSNTLTRPELAFSILAAMTAWTATYGLLLRHNPQRLTTPTVIAVDVVLALLVSMSDAFVYDGAHPQSFGSAWPIAAVLSVGAILGMTPGALAGAGTGLVAMVAAGITSTSDGRWLAMNGSVLLGAIAGVVAGYVSDRLRRAESEVARARAREEFARDLHDGVLQTLAVIQRRSDDADLVALARDQDRELRGFIGDARPVAADLVAELHRSAADIGRRFDQGINVVVIDAPPSHPDHAHFAAAVAEAMTNAAKHADATTVTVCVDFDGDTTTVTVNDDGRGFDVDTTPQGFGMSSSIDARIAELGGTVSVRSDQTRGTEVTFTLRTAR